MHTQVLLAVDDNAAVRRLIQRSLARHYSVLLAASGQEALGFLEDFKVDLVLTDIMMPDMNGFDLADQVARSFPNVPVAFLSAYLDDELVASASWRSPYIIPKPFEVSELTEAVGAILRGSGFVRKMKPPLNAASDPPKPVEGLATERLPSSDAVPTRQQGAALAAPDTRDVDDSKESTAEAQTISSDAVPAAVAELLPPLAAPVNLPARPLLEPLSAPTAPGGQSEGSAGLRAQIQRSLTAASVVWQFKKILSKGRTFKVKVADAMMNPALLMSDLVEVSAISAEELREGDVIYCHSEDAFHFRRFKRHAVLSDYAHLMVSADIKPDEETPVPLSHLIGRVATIERDGQTIRCRGNGKLRTSVTKLMARMRSIMTGPEN
jgi:CheY-like chemotaxis protein